MSNKRHLKNSIENFDNHDHLGGVNELSWFEFLKSFGWTVEPIEERESAPDFRITSPVEFYCETTTLNISEEERKLLKYRKGVPLDHSKTIERIIRKIVDDKAKHIQYGAARQSPSILVLFDYTEWSAYSTGFHKEFAKLLFDDNRGFMELPPELSGIIYVEKKVLNGRIGISKHRSVLYHNPAALFKLPVSVFRMMRQLQSQFEEVPLTLSQDENVNWFWL